MLADLGLGARVGDLIAIVGGGRVGRGLALALAEAGERVTLWSRREATGAVDEAVAGAQTVLLAVPDDVLGAVAGQLALGRAISSDQVVLHLSGRHSRAVLAVLDASGAALGSLHPLQTISAPVSAASRWRGAWAAVEGDERALGEATRLCGLLGLYPVEVSVAAKPAYHAAAVLASNYVVVLAEVAARIAREAGIPPAAAEAMYRPLLLGAVQNLETQRPADALTGPVRRGDAETVEAHLQAVGAAARPLYAMLGLEALALARSAGLEPTAAAKLEGMLRKALGSTDPRS